MTWEKQTSMKGCCSSFKWSPWAQYSTDLREVKHPERRTKYDVFWNNAEMFLSEDIGTAVDERRHSQVTHLAKAISIRDFREQVEAKCPEGTPIPSDEWLRLQFWPKTPKARTALHYTGQLKVRYMVQARQFRKMHVDEHYTAALFRYIHCKNKSVVLTTEWLPWLQPRWRDSGYVVYSLLIT